MKKQQILFYVYWLILILPNVILAFTERINVLGRVTQILMPLAIYGLLLTLRRKPGIVLLWLFPVLFLGAFQIVLTYIFGEGIIAVDMWLNLVTTNSSEVEELLSQLLPAIVGVIILYVPTLVTAVWSLRCGAMLSHRFVCLNRSVGYGLLVVSVVSLVGSYWTGRYQMTRDLFPVNVCYNCYLAFERDAISRSYKENSENFRFHSKSTHNDSLPEVIVCVIGETSRSANWELFGYERHTNPELLKVNGLLTFRDVMSQSNTTHKSVPILLSLASAENYDVLYSSKGILAAYKEAGYYTVFLSNQQRNHSFIDFLGEQADECVFVKERQPENLYDEVLLNEVKNILRLGYGRVFIVLHTYGSHFNYQDRYSVRDRRFIPDSIVSAARKYRKELINAYDNSILYTDHFLANLINLLDRPGCRSAMLYTSDHGEDIFDDDRHLFLHASPVPSYYQLHVPLLIWTSEDYQNSFPQEISWMEKHQAVAAGSDCVFHTLLNLGGVCTPYRNDSLSLASPLFTEKSRLYIDDHNKPLPLSECLDRKDLDVMRQKKMKDE